MSESYVQAQILAANAPTWLKPLLDECDRAYGPGRYVSVDRGGQGTTVKVSDSGQWALLTVHHESATHAIKAAYEALRSMPDAVVKKP